MPKRTQGSPQERCTCDAASDAPGLRWHQPSCPLFRDPDRPQDSPKVPEAAVEALMRRRVAEAFGPQYGTLHGWPKFLRDRPADAARYRELAKEDVRAIVPTIFSALLSDEVVEAVAILFNAEGNPTEDWAFLVEEENECVEAIRAKARKYLQAAIEQVGGAEHGK